MRQTKVYEKQKRTVGIQARQLARLRDRNNQLTEKVADTFRRLKIRRRQVKILKGTVEELQRKIAAQGRIIGELRSSVAEKDAIIERQNRSIVDANLLAGLDSAPLQCGSAGQFGRFMDAMSGNKGAVRVLQGGVAGALG